MPNARSTEVDSLGVINLIGSNLIDRYPPRSILKELLQNADDAGARKVVVGWTPGLGGKLAHQLLRGPALFIVNDGKFTEEDAQAICRFGQNHKFGEKVVIGKFGLGLKSVFHLCEAFFYLSSTRPGQSEDDGTFNNLASPWANTEYHRGWNTVQEQELNLLREFLRPICSQLGSAWFALWLPLRRAEHCNGVRFSAREDGDRLTCPPELGGMSTASDIARALPLLNTVQSVQFWERWESGGSDPSSQVTLETEIARSRFRACVETNSDACGDPVTGRYTTAADRTTTVVYSLVQSWSSDLLPLTERSDWPKSFVLSGGQQPDKAQPHAAVVLGRRVDRKQGGLDVARAVFLPLDMAVREHPESEFQLTLHGCFFVDSGRRHALHVGEDVRGVWNRRLMSEGVLPLIVPAVESLANASVDDAEVVRRLTRNIAEWMAREGNRADVCSKQAWVCRWFPAAPRWERVESISRILEIPEFGADIRLPNLALPGLGDLAMEFVLTPSESPRLTANDPEVWEDDVLARALEVSDPQPLFEASGSGLKYLHRFLHQHPCLETAAHAALLRTLRVIFAAIRTGSLDEHRDRVAQLVDRIPAQFRRSLPLGGNWPEETRRSVCATGSTVLFLPVGFEPEGEPGTATIPTDDAITMLVTLAGAMSPGRNTNPAAAVIRNSTSPAEVIEASTELRLWGAQRLSGERTEAVVCTLRELRVSCDRSTVFVGPANDWLRELAAGLAQELTVVPPDTAVALFPTDGLPVGDLPGILGLLPKGPQLASVPARAPLLRRLIRQHPSDELLARWCWAVRYLLHGSADLSASDDLYLASGSKGVWAGLAQTALATLHQPNRILSDNELSRLLNQDQRMMLRIHALDPNGVAGLLREVDLAALTIQFRPPERDEVIRGLQQHPELIRGLPLHDRADGGMTRITENCYWEGSGAPGTLARHITLLRPCSDAVLAAIQKSAHPHELTPVELVRLALRMGPGEHAEAVLGAFVNYRSLTPEHRKQFTEQRVLVRVTDPSRPVEVTNLLGARITVNARTEFDTLLIGFGLDRIDCPYLEGLRVRCLHLRRINPANLRHNLRELVARTGESALRVFFGQQESQLEFAVVLEEFSGDDAFGVRVAQESFLNGAQYSLRFLGLTCTRNGQLRELLKLAETAANRRAEENAMPDRHLPGESAGTLERAFREELQELVSTSPDVQAELVDAVRRKVQEYRYEPRSVLFELFQNADDAYAERDCPAGTEAVFVVQHRPQTLSVLHNGRPINRPPANADPDTSGYRHDLGKMLSLGHSDKGAGPAAKDVTGRFGLGFKSVFLVTGRPRVVSGRLAFEVLGGVYPREIEHRVAEELRGRVETSGLPRETATIFEFQARNDVDLGDVLEPFRRLAHLLVVFARRIRSIRCGAESASWAERTVVETDHARVVKGPLRPVRETEGSPRQAVIIRCGPRGDVLFGLNESGFAPVPRDLPSIWVTAPTTEQHGVGYLVNAPLDLDVGRSQVTWDAPANVERLRTLGLAAGDCLIALFDAGLGALEISADEDRVWRSLWEVFARPGDRRELHDHLMWGESGAARRLYCNRPVLPTGIDAGAHTALTSIPNLRYVLGGILDEPENERLLVQVVSWGGFARYPSGSVVSDQAVWCGLRALWPNQKPERIDLATVIGNEVGDCPDFNPERAARLGAVISRDLLREMEHGTPIQRSEHARLESHLRSDTRFNSRAGKWAPPHDLLIPRNDDDLREEAMRAAFAPPDRVLADAYDDTGVDFFLACRGQRVAPLDEMARWALTAETEARRVAVLRYLREGDQHYRLQSELHRMGIAGTWLAEIDHETLQRAGYDDRQQTATLVTLGVISADLIAPPAPPESPPEQPTAPQHVFAQIADWWRTQASDRTRQYNVRVYADGRLPQIMADGPGPDVASRVEWLRLFVSGIVQTVGRVTDDQNRTFVRLCETERWLATLADPINGPREWLAAVERYIDRHNADGIRYFYWLRHFIGVVTVARHLGAYADSYLAIDRFDGRFRPRDVLTTRTSRQFQFGGPDAPTLVPILGIGSCFVLRELVRIRLVTREDVHAYCYAPVRRLRQFLERLGWQDDEDLTVHDRSRSIYEFVAEHYPDDPTFGNAFDIPLLMYAEEHPEVIPESLM